MPESLRRFAVFGHPVDHSLSPQIQQAFASQFDMQIAYGRENVSADAFARSMQAFFASGGTGANVTVPHKRAAFELAGRHSEAAERAGVANVLSLAENGEIVADNTDGSGLLRDLTVRRGIPVAGTEMLLLGAGGAARGVLSHFLEAGAGMVLVANRSHARAEALAAQWDDRVAAIGWQALDGLSGQHLILNATSAGLQGHALRLPDSIVDTQTCCCDLSYGPAATSFLRWARQAGAAQAFDGLGMLVETAADSFELWFGIRPDTEPVYQMLANPL